MHGGISLQELVVPVIEYHFIDILLRSIGMEPDVLQEREKWLLLARMIPLVEHNFNLCELRPRSTGKSHLLKEISPNNILASGSFARGREEKALLRQWYS